MTELNVLESSQKAPTAVAQKRSFNSRLFSAFSWPKVRQILWSCTDQFLAVGGMFLANIALARAQSKEEYGAFALSYSIYTFFSGLHNAAVLEPYTIYGPGRYHRQFPQYSRLMWRSNAMIGGVLTLTLLLIWGGLLRTAPVLASRSFLGLGLSVAVLLTALFVRRTLYLRRRPDLAARFSVVFFVTLGLLLLLATKSGLLNGFSTFLIAGASWIVAGLFLRRELPGMACQQAVGMDPNHWSEHWKYARWVLATAFVFQLTTQGYYWLVAGFLSLREVGGLRAIYILVTPVDQVIGALTLLVLPIMSLRYAEKRNSELISAWKLYGVACLILTAGYASLIWALARRLLHTVYAGKFDDLSGLLSVFVLLPIVMGIGNVANVALKSIEKPDFVLYAYVASGAITFIVGIPLVMHFRLRGAVYGMLVSGTVYAITTVFGLARTVRSRLQDKVLFGTAGKQGFTK